MLTCKVKKWGNSLGVVIPNGKAKEMGIRPEDTIIIRVERKENPLRELYGALPLLKPTKKVLHEARRNFFGKHL